MPRKGLRDIAPPVRTVSPEYVWELVAVSPTDQPTLVAGARILAERIVSHLCPAHIRQMWEEGRSGRPLTASERTKLKTFLAPHFGDPDVTTKKGDERALGSIAEFLWLELIETRPETARSLVHLESMGFSPTDPGPDGLAVYRTDSGDLCFYLWEMKKHTAASDVSTKVSEASRQIDERAMSYLARYTKVGQQYADGSELRNFFATLVDQWDTQSPTCGAGVAVSTSWTGSEADCFSGLPTRFPNLATGERLEGLLNAVGNYEAFVEEVKKEVWSAL